MNKNFHRIVFNQRRGCLMAVAETTSSSNKSPSGTSKARRRPSKYDRSTKAGQFALSKAHPEQWIRAQEALNLIVFASPADNSINLLAAKSESSQTSTSTNSSSSSSVPHQQHPLQRRIRHSHPGRIGPDVREKNDIAWFGLDLAPASG